MPVEEHDVKRWFANAPEIDVTDVPDGQQLAVLTRLSRLYERRELVTTAGAQALCHECPNSDVCWAGAESAKPSDDTAGLALPWVGPHYRAGGVTAVGLNLRGTGGLVREFEIAAPGSGARSQWSRLNDGKRKVHGSDWAYRSLRSCAAVRDWLAGHEVEDPPAPHRLAAVLLETARLQAVKCSPRDGHRSSPTQAMTETCPSFLIEDEVACLAPGAIVGFGNGVHDAFSALGWIQDGTDYLAWGRAQLPGGGREASVFWLYHPSGRYWAESQGALIARLQSSTAS